METWFGFSKKEIKGLILLLLLLSLLQLIPFFYEKIAPEQTLNPESEHVFAKFLRNIDSSGRKISTEAPALGQMFPFDPNTLDIAGWERLGLSSKQAGTIMKYRKKGGKFRHKEDLQKMYTISPELYSRLWPYIRIAIIPENKVSVPVFHSVFPAEVKRPAVHIFLNEADSAELMLVRGIGPVFASRILKYRGRLGGFVRLEQLLEVYGMDTLKLEQLRPQLRLDTSRIKRIAVNRVTAEDLRLHPYLSYKQAYVLIAYRKQHGNYLNFASLSGVASIPVATLEKIAPYISFEHD